MILVGIGLFLLAICGAPLFTIIAASAMWGFYGEDVDLSIMAVELFRIAEMPILLAIPLFTFAGYLLSESQAPSRLVAMTRALIGWMPGGLAVVALAACALFTAFTGASGVTIIALGALLYPALLEDGYEGKFSLGLVTTSGSLGLLFAPSLPLILYGIVAQQTSSGSSVSIDRLFLAGALPGILMVAMLSGWVIWRNRHLRTPLAAFSFEKLAVAARASIWDIPLPIIILGGIYGGFFAVSEAATVTAVYVLLVEVLILREIKLRDLPDIVRKSMALVGGIMIILGLSLASTTYMIDAEVPQKLFAFVREHVSSQLGFLILLNLFLLVLGAILDIFSALVLVVPLILPVAVGFDVDPLHLGIIFLANMQLGYLTPPVGLNLFISSYRFEQPITTIYRSTIPFFVVLLLSVLIITYWPGLSLWLAN
ncbi:MAG: C4-dicarboxylate ABC transporter [Desulfuromonas sp.]|nr:MAG: C4-dicarboxylate ABC transporter [Desulfuromonas sp.]